MLFAVAVLANLSAFENGVTENFTGRVLDGSNDRLIRVERKARRSIVVLRDCGPLEPGSWHEFAIWAGGWEDVRPCLAVNGRPPAHLSRTLPSGFGIIYGQVQMVDEDSTRLLGNASILVRCGDKVWNGKSDRRGRFWTALPAGSCLLEATADGHRPIEEKGRTVAVREGSVGTVLVSMRVWGMRERIEGWFRGFLGR